MPLSTYTLYGTSPPGWMKCENTKISTTACRSGTAAAHSTPRLVRLYLAWKSLRASTRITPRWSRRLANHSRREDGSGPRSSTGCDSPRSDRAAGVVNPLIVLTLGLLLRVEPQAGMHARAGRQARGRPKASG